MIRKFALHSLVVVLLCVAAPVRADRIDDVIRAEMARRHIPGASVAVIRNNRVVLERGYGLANIERAFPATPRTM
ncbi:MAG: serine hydrolase, partial [Chthoniobacterales bacterium]